MHTPENKDPLLDADIDELVDEYLSRKQSGENITVEQFADIYSSRREEILSVLPVVEYLESSDPDILPQPLETENLPNVLLGDYQINRLIGFGGMGTVYEAQHFLRNRVALKVMLSKNESDSRRFEREAKILAGLHHPNIVPVFDFGAVESTNFMSMRYVDGPNLSQVLAARRGDDDANPKAKRVAKKIDQDWFLIARIGYQIAQALEYAHGQGVLHRDIKPANLLIESDDNVWVTDFGLAKLNYVASNLTKTGNAVGTIKYMAPEQFENEADVRTDIYSLGITLYELALRNQKSSPSIYTRHPLKKPSQFNPTIPRGLENVILKACEPEPEDRYQTAAELASALARYCGHRKLTHVASEPSRRLNLGAAVCILSFFVLAWVFSMKSATTEPPKTIMEYTLAASYGEKNTHVIYDPETNVSTMITRITSKNDDAEEWNGGPSYPKGSVYWKSTDLELVWDEGDQYIGLRFSDPILPKNATIKSAFIQFTCDQNDVGPTNIEIYGDASKVSETFRKKQFGISSRPRTTAVVKWKNIEPWIEWEADMAERTPDLSDIITEITSAPTWTSNSPLTFIFAGSGKRVATSYDYNPVHAPRLVIEYESTPQQQLLAH